MKKKPGHKSGLQKGLPTAKQIAWWDSDWIYGLAIVAATIIAYLPALNGQPLWDDDGHITKQELQSFTGLKRIWIEPGSTQQYYPLIHTAFWIAHKLWGNAPFGYHLLSILLHALSVLLFLRILRVLEIPGARFAAALFALHPVQVESVAWISELKNTLSGVFYFGAALTYIRLRFSNAPQRQWIRYGLALGLFVLGLLCKTVVATLPAVILVLFWWKRGRLSWKEDVFPLAPFFLSGATAGLYTAWFERKFIGAEGMEFALSLPARILIAGRAIWFYLGKLLWPQDLTFIYPRWHINPASLWQYMFPLAVLVLLVALWLRRKSERGPLAALLLFGGILFPSLGFFNVYPFLYSFVADHFQYLACIAPITLVAAAAATALNGLEGIKARRVGLCCGICLIGALSAITWRQAAKYTDVQTLWQSVIERNPECWMAYANLGQFWLNAGYPDKSIYFCERSLSLKPDNATAENNLGLALLKKGMKNTAKLHIRKALSIKPDYAAGYSNLGMILQEESELDAAIVCYNKALELRSHLPDTQFNLGIALLAKGRPEAAISALKIAAESKPDDVEAATGLGVALLQSRRFSEAVIQLEKVLKMQPTNTQSLNNLAWILSTCNNPSIRNGSKAIALALRATQLSGGMDPYVLRTLAAAYAEAGQFMEAESVGGRALESAEQSNAALASLLRNELRLYRDYRSLRY